MLFASVSTGRAVWKGKGRILVSEGLSGKAKGVFWFRRGCLEKQRAYSGFGWSVWKSKGRILLTLLTSEQNHRILQDTEEREFESALQFVSLQPRRFLREEFETFFLAVAGPAWSEDLDEKKGLTPSNAQLELVQASPDFDSTRSIERTAEGRWTTLSIKVVAAAYLT